MGQDKDRNAQTTRVTIRYSHTHYVVPDSLLLPSGRANSLCRHGSLYIQSTDAALACGSRHHVTRQSVSRGWPRRLTALMQLRANVGSVEFLVNCNATSLCTCSDNQDLSCEIHVAIRSTPIGPTRHNASVDRIGINHTNALQHRPTLCNMIWAWRNGLRQRNFMAMNSLHYVLMCR